jgi:hypothetical protein
MAIQILHWLVYIYYAYLFGKASLLKVFQVPAMMNGMEAFGFGKTWTLLIGYAELAGVVGLIVGLWIHEIRNASVIFLFLFAVGALMVHFAHRDYSDYYEALSGCICALVLLATDKFFKISL